MSNIKFNPIERFIIIEPVIDEVYWLQFYEDRFKTQPTDYLWLTKWGKDGNNKFSICAYHNEKYKNSWYSEDVAIFTSSISGNRHNLYLPRTEELAWHRAMELIGKTSPVPNIEEWLKKTTINNDILIFN